MCGLSQTCVLSGKWTEREKPSPRGLSLTGWVSAQYQGEHWRGSDASECILPHGGETGLSHFSLHQQATSWGYPRQGDPGGQAAPVQGVLGEGHRHPEAGGDGGHQREPDASGTAPTAPHLATQGFYRPPW